MVLSVLEPDKATLHRAKEIACVVPEVLSLEIASNRDKTQAYIERNEAILIQQGVLESAESLPEFSDAQIQERRKWLNRQTRQVVLIPLLMFSLISWLVMSQQPIAQVIEETGVNEFILAYLPNAQGWVNISPVYRNQLIILYPIFYLIWLYILLASVWRVIIHRHKFKDEHYVPIRHDVCFNTSIIMVGIFLFGTIILLYVFGFTLEGAEALLQMSELDNDKGTFLFTDKVAWNSVFGFIFHKAIYAGVLGASVFIVAQAIATIKWCSKYSLYAKSK